jgi:DNA-binding transcriptional ArsR family regulator
MNHCYTVGHRANYMMCLSLPENEGVMEKLRGGIMFNTIDAAHRWIADAPNSLDMGVFGLEADYLEDCQRDHWTFIEGMPWRVLKRQARVFALETDSSPNNPMHQTYRYLGDRLTRPELRGAVCTAVLDARGKCIRGRNGNMLVSFGGVRAVVLGRLLAYPPGGAAVTIPQLTPELYQLSRWLWICANHEGICWRSLGRLARNTGLSKETVAAGLEELEKMGLLVFIQRAGYRAEDGRPVSAVYSLSRDLIRFHRITPPEVQS